MEKDTGVMKMKTILDDRCAEALLSDIEGIAHEIFSAAQLLPGEGIEDGVERIIAIIQDAANSEREVRT